MTTADPSCEMLDALTQCAYRLGLAFGAEAEREKMSAKGLEYFQLFDRCFFSVRVAIGLQLRLRQAQPALRSAPEREELRERGDPAERDTRTPPDPVERERDREVEPVSMSVFLKTLQGVAADAANLPGPPHEALPTLQELLAQITGTPASTPAKPAAGLRARLATSATAPSLTLPPPTGPKRPTLSVPLPRATGPPRR